MSGSASKKRLIAGIVGVAYAFAYGFWTLLITGGGHVNFVWAWLFFVSEFFGLYFPLMAVLAVDLRNFFVKIIFGALIGLNLIISAVTLADWATAGPEADRASDFERTVNVNGFGSVFFDGVIHFLPTVVFLVLLLRSIGNRREDESRDSLSKIELPS